MKPEALVELKLSTEKVQTTKTEYERSGLRFIKLVTFVVVETITTDRLQVTEEAVRCFNHPSR